MEEKNNFGGGYNTVIAVLLEAVLKKKISKSSNRSEQLAEVQRHALPIGGFLNLLAHCTSDVRNRNLICLCDLPGY